MPYFTRREINKSQVLNGMDTNRTSGSLQASCGQNECAWPLPDGRISATGNMEGMRFYKRHPWNEAERCIQACDNVIPFPGRLTSAGAAGRDEGLGAHI